VGDREENDREGVADQKGMQGDQLKFENNVPRGCRKAKCLLANEHRREAREEREVCYCLIWGHRSQGGNRLSFARSEEVITRHALKVSAARTAGKRPRKCHPEVAPEWRGRGLEASDQVSLKGEKTQDRRRKGCAVI